MKDGMDSTAARRAPETEEFTNRKLIRPSLGRPEYLRQEGALLERRDRPERVERPAPPSARRLSPPEQTHAENFYYQKQMQSRTPMVVVLKSGEQLQGVIEWYDKNCIKLTRATEPDLLVYKPSIKYIFKFSENGQNP